MRIDADYYTANQYALGTGESTIVTERETPTDFEFYADSDQAVRQRVAVRVTNTGDNSTTEDVTVTLNSVFGTDISPIESETTSVTVGAGETATPSVLADDAILSPGTYRVSVSLSGASLEVKQTAVHTRDIQIAWDKEDTPTPRLIDHTGRRRMVVPPLQSGVKFPGGIIGQDGVRVASFAGSGLSVDDSGDVPTLQSSRESETVTVSGDGSATVTLPHDLGETPAVAHVTAASADAMGDYFRSNMTDTTVELTYASAPPSGTDNLAYDLTVVGGEQ